MYKLFRRCQCRCHLTPTRRISSNPWVGQYKTKEVNINVGKSVLKLSTGKLARFADGCVVAQLGDTSVMVTAVSKNKPSTLPFLPLTVDYRQKAAAAGRIPTNYLRRELGPSDREILTSRMIDRSIRPLFPANFNCDTQIMCNLLAVDGYNDPDIASINAASAALSLSDIPWNGPVGAVRVGYVDKEAVINPTRKELANSQLNLIVTGTENKKIVMLEGSAEGIQYEEFVSLLHSGLRQTQVIVNHIKQMQQSYGAEKRALGDEKQLEDDIQDAILSLSQDRIKDVFTNYEHHKISRDNAIQAIKDDVLKSIVENYPEVDQLLVQQVLNEITKDIFRSLIMETSVRCDGRGLTDLRPINCEVDLYKPLHGSALFQRGQTQVLCTVTFDSPESAAKLDTISAIMTGIKEKNFFLHYEFPPYATNETGRGGFGRRELGHGALAEKALRAVIPNYFPFTIRLTSEVLESNGSSSMATVCGGSLALMDAGVPIKEPAAGVAVGVVTKVDQESNSISEYKLLTDLLGIEDYFGDMDFKLAGTHDCVTAIQADIKLCGMPANIITEAVSRGRDGIRQILAIMAETQSEPRHQKKVNAPVLENLDIPVTKRAKFLGYGGYNLKKITADTGVTITPVDDNTFQVFAPNQVALDEAKEKIEELLAEEREPELEFGAIYNATIVELREHGVMVQLYKNMVPAFIHNSQLDQRKVSHPSALGFVVGQEIPVKYFGRDPVSGKIRLSRKVLFSPASTVIKELSPKNTR